MRVFTAFTPWISLAVSLFWDIIGVLDCSIRDRDMHITVVKSERLTGEATITTILVSAGLANSRGLSSTSQVVGT
jgi:hypothetical protein